MKRTVFLSAVILLAAGAVRAEVPRPHEAVADSAGRPGAGAAAGFCSILYYEPEAASIWIWSGWLAGDRAGVVFDLPAECGKKPGTAIHHDSFWWYWRHTVPGWGYTVSYDLYEVDAKGAPKGEPLGSIESSLPMEGWNHYGGFGSIEADRVALVASWTKGVIPSLATDRPAPGRRRAPHSFFYGREGEDASSRPIPFTEKGKAVQVLMSASFGDAPADTAAKAGE
ncbi:MAG: hypothetical protein JW958_02850 [Candidatus Eisenbacteria bacterium]|nr:hypothetical protein [Candidatus Eisenbacteria bacterium]